MFIKYWEMNTMRKPRRKSVEIRQFILENVSDHPRDITLHTSKHYNISRPAVLRHINKLIADDVLVAHGSTRDRLYELKPLVEETFSFNITPDVEEDRIWRHVIRPLLVNLSDNVLRIGEYGLSEMINNVIEHSEGTKSTIHIEHSIPRLEFTVADNGVGIFNKIQRDIQLEDARHAILELSKGKLTTDPDHHTGEGIFFTSRMFDDFVILSEGLFFSHDEPGDDWLIEHKQNVMGTTVRMGINPNTERNLQDVFNAYTSDDFEFDFTKTHVPVSLAIYDDENLVSRSQARRLLARFHQFKEVFLDFQDVETVGQAFADEIFRVFARNNPGIDIIAINTNPQIDGMIQRAKARL